MTAVRQGRTRIEPPQGMVPAMDGTMPAHLSYWQVLGLIQRGEVRGERIGRNWFIDIGALLRWRAERDRGAKADR
jgi:hypothetical protein